MAVTRAYRYSFRVPRPNLGSRAFASGNRKALPRQRLPASTRVRPVDIANVLKIGGRQSTGCWVVAPDCKLLS
jgi:hypothetical protein